MEVEKLYSKAIEKYMQLQLKDGMAIFYTPLIANPRLLLIGDNPGSTKGEVHSTCPKQNDYFLGEDNDYDLAKKMRFIFSTGKLPEILKSCVKINRVFFRSSNIDELKKRNLWKPMEEWCAEFVFEIIKGVNPKVILCESIESYKSILRMLDGRHLKDLVIEDGKSILREGEGVSEEFLVLGIYHPSSKWSKWISKEAWTQVSNELNKFAF